MKNDRRANVGGDLVLSPRSPNVTITHWLYEELRRAVLDGRLGRGAAIPPTRSLASDYGVSRRIVVNVFDQLRDEGYLTAKVGAGTRVSDNIPEDFLAPSRPKRQQATDPAGIDVFYRRPIRPFRPIEPALSEFPIDVWGRLAGRCLRTVSTAVLAGGDPAGHRPLREAISAYLGSSRGVSCSPDQIVITSGTQQALDLLARVLLRPGDNVWVEDPGYSGAVDTFRLAGAKIVPVPVDEYGLNFDHGRAKCPTPRAIYLTPAHQFPLGATLRLDRRLELLQWTRRNNALILEDDYDSEFRFSGRPVPAMKGLAGSEHVFLMGTFNKSLFPALRLGYVVVPDPWLDAVLNLRRQVEFYPPGLSQLVLASFISEGYFAKHLRRMRELYGARLAALRHDMESYLAGALKLPEIQAGLNTPAFLLNGMTSLEASKLAQLRNLEAWPLDRFAIARKDLRGLILGFAAFNEREIRSGVMELSRALTNPGVVSGQIARES
jgi:GntR family transcriptional regulator / MocR family aminotransferase